MPPSVPERPWLLDLNRVLSPPVALLALLLAGCGQAEREQTPQPKLPRALATELAARSDRVAARLAADDPCSARADAEALQHQVIAAVNERRVPARYLEELTSAVNALVDSIVCVFPEGNVKDDDRVKPLGRSAQDARNLAEWLRANSR